MTTVRHTGRETLEDFPDPKENNSTDDIQRAILNDGSPVGTAEPPGTSEIPEIFTYIADTQTDTEDLGEITTEPLETKNFWTKRKLLGAFTTFVVLLGAGGTALALKGDHDTPSPRPAATSTPNPALAFTGAPSTQEATPTPPATMTELPYYSNEGNVNVTRLLPTDALFQVSEKDPSTGKITNIVLPELRDPYKTSATECVNSYFALYSAYMRTNTVSVAETIQQHLTNAPGIIQDMLSHREISQDYVHQSNIPFELTTFQDSNVDPAQFAIQGEDADGSVRIVLTNPGSLKQVHYTGWAPDAQNGNIQNIYTVLSFTIAVNPQTHKLTDVDIQYADTPDR